MDTNFDHRKSLQELEGDDWGEPGFESTLVRTCHRLRRVPLVNFAVGDLRIMIGQKIGLPFLVPLALEILAEDPLVEGTYYPGDLLSVVIEVPAAFWSDRPEICDVLGEIVLRAEKLLVASDESDEDDALRKAVAKAAAIARESRR